MDPQRPPRIPSGNTTVRPRAAAPSATSRRPLNGAVPIRTATSRTGISRAGSRRPSRRTFLVRRLLVLGVVAVIVIGLVTVVKSVFTDEPSSAATATQPTALDDPAMTVGAVVTAPADPNLATTTILP